MRGSFKGIEKNGRELDFFADAGEPVSPPERFTAETTERLDISISRQLGVTRAFARKLIEEGRVEIDGLGLSRRIKPSYKIAGGDSVVVSVPPPETLEIEPEDVPFQVVYEDRHLLVVNKPAGLVVHPAPGHWRGTLVHGLLFRWPDLGPFNNVTRPGIVHRLDATTSGLMLVAREQKTMESLQKAFKERSVEKSYLALVHNQFERLRGTLEGPIGRHPQNRLKMAVVEGGRPSATEYRVLWNRPGYAFAICGLLTGRTHQIRVHMATAGHPLVGDVLYGAKGLPNFARVFLHSWRLAFTHPSTGQPLTFTCPLPGELREQLTALIH
ncbi:MAG: RluA family pseudouridine synthase [Synergistaceae bacterium]|jgi:23S rRNA pseudouridine1911/1915/1917 synthase|nr:RluA family pseudouridine synthase [Synergistaceae bacterium]